MSRAQSVGLRCGQRVRIGHFPGRYWTITKIYTPTAGSRVLELEAMVWVSVTDVVEVLPPTEIAA